MSDFVPKDLTGSLFKNDRKNTANHPDYTGSIMVNGQEFWLSAWLKDRSGGGKYMSLGLKAKDAPSRPQAAARPASKAAPPQQSYAEELDDEIPF